MLHCGAFGGAFGGTEHTQCSSTTKLYARVRDGALGALGADTDAFVSFQREGLGAGAGAAGWATLLALSQTKTQFTGRDSMKLDREEEVMITILQEPVEDNI